MLNESQNIAYIYDVKRNNRKKRTALLAFLLLVLPSLVWAARISDNDITRWVKDALRRDARVDALNLNVTTTEGIVALSGSVDNLAAKTYAVLEAKKIDGVLGVLNEIQVLPNWRSDADIRNAVYRRILNSAVINSDGISTGCVDGRVTLSGKVASYSEKKEADLLAGEIRGVKEVTNNITIEWATQRSNQAIKNDAVAALTRDVYVAELPIAVMVDDAVVTLRGTVGSAYEKDRAGSDVRWIANVKDVKNQLKVEWLESEGVRKEKPSLSDTELKETVHNALVQDIRLNTSDIDLVVAYGGVTLKGSVYSHYEKRIAEQDAHDVVGVGWVTNNLFVRTDSREDWAILDDVKFNLATDVTTEALDINVNVANGVVTLSGNVNTWFERLHAESIVDKVKGVRNVINHIEVYPETTRLHASAMVAKDMKEQFKKNWTLRGVSDRIAVSVKDGVATLTGTVDTWAQRRQAEEIAYKTQGVWKIDNRLQVKGYDYNWSDWYHAGEYPWYLP